MIQQAIEIAARLAEDGLLAFDGDRVRLTSRGRLLSNDVCQEFLGLPSRAALAMS
jgi:oxygen-independent coproporphyrinogen-3 oxidase